MTRLGLVAAPVAYAVRRMRDRPLAVAIVTLALAGAAGLLGWSSAAGALSHEESVRLRLRELRPDERSLQVVYHLAIGERDDRGPAVRSFFEDIEDVAIGARRVEVWHSVGPEVQLVVPEALRRDAAVSRGRLPRGCDGRTCEALALGGDFRVGQRIRLGRDVVARVVGEGSLHPQALAAGSEALPQTPEITSRSLLVRSIEPPLVPLVRLTGATVVTAAPLDPEAIHAADLRSLSNRLRERVVRLERDAQAETTAPFDLLDELATLGEIARARLLLVAGQAAALVVAFAAFAASARRADTRLLEEQLATLGASRFQIALARLVEALIPGVVGAGAALVALWLGTRLLAVERRLGSGFPSAALPAETLLAIAAVAAAAIVLLVAAGTPRRRARFGFGALEVAALAALGVVAWQTASTGALDPDRIDGGAGAGPLLLLVPALAFFATGVLLLRLVPLVLRLAEKTARTAPFSVRLAFIAAARDPGQAAATTTFLGVALGAALFGLNYRATLEQQARDEGRFTSGAVWRVTERAGTSRERVEGRRRRSDFDASPATGADVRPVGGSADVTPLTRFRRVSNERPTPVLRLPGRVREAGVGGANEGVEVLALPAPRIPGLLGWRDGFSSLTRAEIRDRLRRGPERLAGVPIARDARVLRVPMRGDTRLPRFVLLHFLLPEDQRFAHLRLGPLTLSWRTLQLRVPRSLRGAELVGIEFPPLFVPFALPADYGMVEVGRFEQRRRGGWSLLPPLRGWAASAAGGSVDVLRTTLGPVKRRLQFMLEDTPQALLRPSPPLPDALPVLASDPIAAAAVDGRITLDLQGREVRARVVASARLFPTVMEEPSRFVVLDYDTLFAALNLDQPGLALPSEAWFFERQRPGFLDRLREPPFRVEAGVGVEPLTERLISDPLAAGTREVLGLAALAAAALGLLGLVLAARSTVASERVLLAEYEALGVPPATLTRSTQLRLLALSFLGLAAALLGGLLAVRLVGAFVAITGASTRPLPPIEPVVAWKPGAALLTIVALAAVATAAVLAAVALRETAARRLRA